ncbi:MAG TPA: DUF1349 domain-containing protein [Acidimicrobiales bacterium]|nr:DUF1349 domain-containing protein [Acidimicrobiales bacterium]
MRRVAWGDATWLNPPPAATVDGADLVVTAGAGTDLWRTTAYGFVHNNGHALLTPLPVGTAVEVRFVADLTGRFDQAGALVWVDEQRWTKAGCEQSDGALQMGAVVTGRVSDWSVAPVPEWAGRQVTVRASRGADALIVRARVDDEPWRLIRLSPFPGDAAASAGPYFCAPEREGLQVRFTGFAVGPADTEIHPGETA